MIDERRITAHRGRALSPDHPVLRGSAQNPDVFFQSREAANPYFLNLPAVVEGAMERFGRTTGRHYRLFDYEGAPDAERVIVMMGSGAGGGGRGGCDAERTRRPGGPAEGPAVPAVQRGALRPGAAGERPHIAVLDRTKEPGAVGEPLYQDVVTAINEMMDAADTPFRFFPRVIGGRYGLGSKEFTPAMAAAVFDELDEPSPRVHFTVGIYDDVSFTSLPYDPSFSTEHRDVVRAVFYGLGADGTVGANKNSIKIIGEQTELHAQGYFVYDSKKSGSTTISHLRFGPQPIRSTYLVSRRSSSAATSGSCSSGSTCSSTRPLAARSCSTRRTRPRRCGITCRGRSGADRREGLRCSSSTPTPSRRRRASASG
jgi:pyruvate-ferredoxin/flavodoxin oxidoreductase